MKTVYLFICLVMGGFSFGQSINEQLEKGIKNLIADPQFKHAILSFYVVESNTGKVVYDLNSAMGLAPASCQKLLTSVTAFEILGKSFHYKTYLGKDPTANKNFDAGSLIIIGRGDPTLGSWRWKTTTANAVFLKITALLQKHQLTRFERNLYIDDMHYGLSIMPEGWIWQDMGNYYGAPAYGFNWHENQYDLILKPGLKLGDLSTVVATKPRLPALSLVNGISTGPPGSGDNGYIYSVPFSNIALTKGTIPLQKEHFTISGSMPLPSKPFRYELIAHLLKNNISIDTNSYAYTENYLSGKGVAKAMQIFDSISSPPLDSINHWFLKRSVNLYGEALLKSIAVKLKPATLPDHLYDTAIRLVKNFWSAKGIAPGELNILDGSGLSPANRLTTHSLVTILQYAQQQKWFSSFYSALPEMNGSKMKDGYIGGVRSYAGYVKSRSGTSYTFSMIVNNFSGSPGTVREKMWKLLDLLN